MGIKCCKDCTERHIGCHGSCPEYIAQAQAAREEREKPCEVGDKVFQQNGVDVFESQVKKIIYDCGHFAFDEESIGERVFLSRESAEAALKGEQA